MPERSTGKPLTAPQRAAIHPDASVWLSASAGTGKTHVLTARVLRMMLEGVDPGRILCLTLTKAAAAEMANRLYDILGQWVGLDDHPLEAAIHARTGAKADAQMRDRARALFAHVLDLPGGLRISTFHAFCQSVLGRFPLEAGLSPHFQVLDDAVGRERRRAAASGVLQHIRQQRRTVSMAALRRIATQINELAFENLMAAFIGERHAVSEFVTDDGDLTDAARELRRRLDVPANGDRIAILRHSLSNDTLDRDGLFQLADAMENGSDSDCEKARALFALLEAAETDRPDQYDVYRDIFLTKDLAPRRTVATKKALKDREDLVRLISDEQARLLALESQCQHLEILENSLAALCLAGQAIVQYTEDKRRLGALDYEDLILYSRRLLASPGIAPWVLYKLDGGLDHILVDEAQDTNAEQWQVIEAIAADFYSGESAREGIATLFAVGDVKQSIYRFQRADPEEFLRARERTRERAHAAQLEFHNRQLRQSFRSTPAVLALVDAVFEPREMRVGLTEPDETIQHEFRRVGTGGLVELWEPELPRSNDQSGQDRVDGEDTVWPMPTVQEADDRPVVRLADRIADRISDMLDGEELSARDRPIRPGDIMILVRRRNEFVDAMIRALMTRGIPVAGSDRIVLTEQLAVMDLMALGAFALMPEDDLNLAVVLKSPLAGLDDDDLFDLAHGRTGTLWQSLAGADDPIMTHIYRSLKTILAEADQTAPFEFFARILNEKGGRRQILSRLGPESDDAMDEFLERALVYERTKAPSLQGFLHWIGADSVEVKRDMEQTANEVRVMTVHGAKGLEAPIVFLPDTCQTSTRIPSVLKLRGLDRESEPDLLIWRNSVQPPAGPVADAIDHERAEQDNEYRRLLYVALTRAEDRLYISGWETQNKRPETSWYDRILAAFDRMEGVIETADSVGRPIRRFETAQEIPVSREIAPRKADGPIRLPQWLARPAPAEQGLPHQLAPSRLGETAPAARSPLGTEQVAGLHRGRLIHRMLEFLPDLPKSERDSVAKKFLSRPGLGLSGPDRDTFWHEVQTVLEDPAFGEIFGPESRSEVAVSGLVSGHVVTGQVDRIKVTSDTIWIIDYKTNRPPPEREADIPTAYIRQMAAYRAVLANAYPGRAVRCALLWTDVPRLMEIAQATLDGAKPGARLDGSGGRT